MMKILRTFLAGLLFASTSVAQVDLFEPRFRLNSETTAQDSVVVLQAAGSSSTKQAVEIPWADFVSLMGTGSTGFGASELVELTVAGEAVVASELSGFMAVTAIPNGGGAGSDDLDTITIAGVTDGTLVLLTYTDSANITVRSNVGNIDLGTGTFDYLIDAATKSLLLRYHSATSTYVPVSFRGLKVIDTGDASLMTAADRGAVLVSAVGSLASGDTLVLSPGTYTTGAALSFPANTSLVGNGRGSTIVNVGGNPITVTDGVTLRGVSFVGGNVVGVDVDDVTLDSVELDGTGMAVATDLISITGGNSLRLVLRNCYVHGATQDNVRIDAGCDVQIIGGTYSDATRDGISLEATGQHLSVPNLSNSAVITGVTVGRNGRYGIYSTADHDIRISSCAIEYNDDTGLRLAAPIQPMVVGCILEYNGSTAYTDAQIVLDLSQLSIWGVTESNASITGCNLASDSTNAHLIKILGTHASRYNIAITGNHFLDPSTAALTAAIALTDFQTTYGLVITGNYFSGRGGTGDNGIVLGSALGTITPEAVLIADNVFHDYGLYAMHIHSLEGVVVQGNLFTGNTHALYSNAGAGTFRLSDNVFRNSSGAVVNLTGSTATVVSLANEGLADDPSTSGFPAPEAVTISGGVATIENTGRMISVELTSEGGTGADALDTVTVAGVTDGTLIMFTSHSGSDITFTHGSGNMDLNGQNPGLNDVTETIILRYEGSLAEYVLAHSSPNTLTVEIPETWAFALSDPTTAVTASDTVPKDTFYAPHAMTISSVGGMATTAPVGATMILDIHLNGTSIMTTDKIDILTTTNTDDGTATLTTTAIAAGDKLEFFIDQIGSGTAGAGVKIWIDGTRD